MKKKYQRARALRQIGEVDTVCANLTDHLGYPLSPLRGKSYKTAGFSTSTWWRCMGSGNHRAIRSTRSASLGMVPFSMTCGQSLPQTNRSGAAANKAFTHSSQGA